MTNISNHFRLNGRVTRELQTALDRIAKHYIDVATNTNVEIPRRKQVEWLRREVIKPAQRLSDAFDKSNRFMFGIYPHPMTSALPSLEELQHRTVALCKWIEVYISLIAKEPKSEKRDATLFRIGLLMDLGAIYAKLLPNHPMTRVVEKGEKGVRGEFAYFLRTAAEPILGMKENLDGPIQYVAKAFALMKNST